MRIKTFTGMALIYAFMPQHAAGFNIPLNFDNLMVMDLSLDRVNSNILDRYGNSLELSYAGVFYNVSVVGEKFGDKTIGEVAAGFGIIDIMQLQIARSSENTNFLRFRSNVPVTEFGETSFGFQFVYEMPLQSDPSAVISFGVQLSWWDI